MKAAYISYADFGGPIVHTREFARAFREFVPDLVLHCPFLDAEISVGRDRPPSLFNRIFSHLPAWSRRLKLEFYLLRKLTRDRLKRRFFEELYREGNVDIVVIRHDAFLTGAITAALKAGIPYILETNGILSKHSKDSITQRYERFVFSRAAGITAVCESLADMLVEVGVNREDLIVVHNGVRPGAYESPDRSVLPPDLLEKLKGSIVLGYTGTFTPYHDLKSLIHSFSQAIEEIPSLKLLVVGEGSRDSRTIDFVAEAELGDSVIFTGHVPHTHIPAYTTLCDVLVNPLIQIYSEGFHGVPIKLLEYMATGKPIISTDLPSVRHVLGESALFIPERDTDSWREAIIRLASDADLRRRIGETGPSRLRSQGYTWQENSRRVFDFCRQILQKEKNGR